MTEEMAMQYQRGYIDGFKEGKAIFEPKIGCKGCIYENAKIYQEKERRITEINIVLDAVLDKMKRVKEEIDCSGYNSIRVYDAINEIIEMLRRC